MNKHGNRHVNGKQAMSTNLRKIARQNQLYGFHMALDGVATTWGALIQNLRCDADLTDEQEHPAQRTRFEICKGGYQKWKK